MFVVLTSADVTFSIR